METRYSVRQTADITGVKPYVLRYWEEELGIVIQRNEMGHRYYTGDDIQLILNIKELKRKGLQLRAVKNLLPEMMNTIQKDTINKKNDLEIIEEHKEKEIDHTNSLQNIKEVLKEAIEIEDDDAEEHKILEFQSILERLILRELSARDEEEEKCRSLDMAIRRQQLVRKEAAASSEKKSGKRQRMKQSNFL